MICKTCAIAGDMVAEARPWKPELLNIHSAMGDFTLPTRDAVRSVAHLFHGLCKGPSHCDCQHKVDFEGKTIQK